MKESQLRELIKESIMYTLNELDWRTYRSAGGKAAKRGEERAKDFYNAANMGLGREHELNNNPDLFTGINTIKTDRNTDGTHIGPNKKYTDYVLTGKAKDKNIPQEKRDPEDYDFIYGTPGDWTDEWQEDAFTEIPPEHLIKMNAAKQDLDKYKQGRYKYDKKSGKWVPKLQRF